MWSVKQCLTSGSLEQGLADDRLEIAELMASRSTPIGEE
jgi:hypothetical protein